MVLMINTKMPGCHYSTYRYYVENTANSPQTVAGPFNTCAEAREWIDNGRNTHTKVRLY